MASSEGAPPASVLRYSDNGRGLWCWAADHHVPAVV